MEEVISVFVAFYAVVAFVLICAFILILFVYHSRNKMAFELKMREYEFQKELNNLQNRSKEEEQRKIGSVLHDDLGQILTLIWIQATTLRQENEGRKLNYSDFQRLDNYAQLAKEKCTSLSKMLYPAVLMKLGFHSGLEDLISEIEHNTGLAIELNCGEFQFPELISNNLYRIIQELINNTVKHSKATNSKIFVSMENGFVIVDYSDNGIGLSPDKTKSGLGLSILTNRIHVLGGVILNNNNNHTGYQMSFKIPYGKD